MVIGELLYKVFSTKREVARKTVHVLAGLAASSFVIFLERKEIAILMAIFVIILSLVRRYKIVKALYNVKRVSYGEILFPLGVGLGALVASSDLVYVYAMLILGLADTAAGIVGSRIGRKKVIATADYLKTYAGSSAFLLIASAIGIVFYIIGDASNLPGVFLVSIGLTFIEAISPFGTDNALLPTSAAFMGGFIF